MRQVVYEILTALPGQREGRVFKVRSPRNAFESAVAVAKIDDLHFHDLRHHFASHFMMRGGDLLALQKILGHASVTMTQKYAHLSPSYLRDAMDRTARTSSEFSTQVSTHEVECREVASGK